MEPAHPYKGNWHLDCIAEHLEAVTAGQIRNLLINIPPRHMKSLGVCVFWPTWEWIREPAYRYIFASYTDNLTKRDAVKARRLMQSEWFQSRWGDRFHLVGDQNAKERYENDHTGFRIATSVKGMGTGEGGDRIIADDPHNVIQGESEAERKHVVEWWTESMSTRGNDAQKVARIIIMQRVHEEDLSGWAIESGHYHHLCLPARYEPQRYYPGGKEDPIKPHKNCPIYSDPRTEDGELMWANRFPEQVQEQIESEMDSPYAIAAQMQQRPVAREGSMFREDMFRPLPPWFYMPSPTGQTFAETLPTFQFYDLAYSEAERADWTVGGTGKIDQQGNIYLLNVVRWKATEDKLPSGIADHIATTKPDMVGIESAAFRKKSTEDLVRLVNMALNGRHACPVIPVPVAKDKTLRAQLPAQRGNYGMLYADRTAPWWSDFLQELTTFPMGKNDDQVDMLSGLSTLSVLNANLMKQGETTNYRISMDRQRQSKLTTGDDAQDWFAKEVMKQPVDVIAPSEQWKLLRRLHEAGIR